MKPTVWPLFAIAIMNQHQPLSTIMAPPNSKSCSPQGLGHNQSFCPYLMSSSCKCLAIFATAVNDVAYSSWFSHESKGARYRCSPQLWFETPMSKYKEKPSGSSSWGLSLLHGKWTEGANETGVSNSCYGFSPEVAARTSSAEWLRDVDTSCPVAPEYDINRLWYPCPAISCCESPLENNGGTVKNILPLPCWQQVETLKHLHEALHTKPSTANPTTDLFFSTLWVTGQIIRAS